MKALPCLTASCPTQGLDDVLRKGKATIRGGGLYLLGRAPMSSAYRYSCSSCKRPTTIGHSDWNRLPSLTVQDLEALGVLPALTKDLQGTGHSEDEAKDLFAAGFRPGDLEELTRKDGDP